MQDQNPTDPKPANSGYRKVVASIWIAIFVCLIGYGAYRLIGGV